MKYDNSSLTPKKVLALATEGCDKIAQVMDAIPWEKKNYYGAWLAQTFHYVTHTTRILSLGASYYPGEDKRHHRLLEQCGEERGHDLLAVNDLKRIGFQISQFPELPTSRVLYQTAHFMMTTQDPVAIFGYALPLEKLSTVRCETLFQLISKHYGDKSGIYLKVHAGADEIHMQAYEPLFSKMTPKELSVVYQTAWYTIENYLSFLEGIKDQAKQVLAEGPSVAA